jgi:hypothetical protein
MNAYDRRLSAIHEAGHVIMAVYLGYTASAWIHTNETRDPLAEKTWLGHATVPDRPRACDHPHNRMIAVAGMVAERLWKNGHDEEYAEPYGWEDILWDEECMSFSDWWNADCEPGEPDGGLYDVVAEVAGLFMGDLWSDLTDTARVLMTEPETGHTFRPAVNTGSRDAA